MARIGSEWIDVTRDAWLLWAESLAVVSLRTARLARGGPEACVEARRMMREKFESTGKLGTALVEGRLGARPETVAANTIAHYRAIVRANRKRLSRGRY